MKKLNKLEKFMLPEHFNHLLPYEASTSLNLTREVADKLNEVIDVVNELDDEYIREFFNQNAAIRKAVLYMKDNLLNSLNDLMVTLRDSGFIDDRILYHCRHYEQEVNEVTARLENLLGSVTEGSTTMDAEVIDLRTDLNGSSYVSAGKSIRTQLGTTTVGRKAIEQGDSLDMDDYIHSGTYVFTVYSGLANMPEYLISGSDIARYLIVEGFGTNIPDLGDIQTWGKQTILTENGEKAYKRFYKWDYQLSKFVFEDWKPETENNQFQILYSGDVNKIVEPDSYIVASGELSNMPFSGRGCLLKVHTYSYGWLVQEITGLPDFRQKWYRVGNNGNQAIRKNNADGLSVTWSQWEKQATMNDVQSMIENLESTLSNSGYKIVNFGDSIFGNFRDETNVSNVLALSTGATVYNLGFGGCRMSGHYDHWDAFSMYNLATAIANNDFSMQDAEIQDSSYVDRPEYFAETVELLKNIDFSDVDVVTIAYGVNDYTSGQPVNSTSTNVRDSYKKSLEYSIETLQSAYPNLKIVLITPCWMYFKTESGTPSGDEKQINNQTIKDFVDAVHEAGNKYCLPVVKSYYELGINEFTKDYYLIDGIHLNEKGRKSLGKLIANTIRGL